MPRHRPWSGGPFAYATFATQRFRSEVAAVVVMALVAVGGTAVGVTLTLGIGAPHGVPAPGTSGPTTPGGSPTGGTPTTGLPTTGSPTSGTGTPGTNTPGTPTGTSTTGGPTTGSPTSGVPTSGSPTSGSPSPTGTGGPVPPDPPAPSVVPGEVNLPLAPGSSTVVDKKVRTPVIPPRPDVVLLVDGTGSMEPSIEDVRKDIDTITGRVREGQPDSRFAVATYGDQAVDGERVFQLLQPLTYDLDKVREGVGKLDSALGEYSKGPAEDWINAVWQISQGAGGGTQFRPGSSPIIVIVGDASSHDPSKGHTLADATRAAKERGIRVIAVDVATSIGDGLNGNGDNGKGYPAEGDEEGELHEPNQATKLVNATNGRLFQGIDPDKVADTIADGLANLPTTVGYRLVDCPPSVSVSMAPPTRTVTSGEDALFKETVTVSGDAPQGATLTCRVQFILGAETPDQRVVGPGDDGDERLRQTITIPVRDVTAPVVTVDDRNARAPFDQPGARIDYVATAVDSVGGALPVVCAPPSGTVFPVGTTTVVCTATDSSGNTGSDSATFTVTQLPPPPAPPPPPSADVAVTVTAAPVPGYTGTPVTARYTVTNAGPDTATGIVVSGGPPPVTAPGQRDVRAQSACTSRNPCSLAPGGRLEVVQELVYTGPVREGTLRAGVASALPDPRTANNTATTLITVLQPVLTVSPAVAAVGQVVQVRGVDFPPGTVLSFGWDVGITANAQPTVVPTAGSFDAQVLILPKDRVGPRQLLVGRPGGAPPARVPVLVVPRNEQPPELGGSLVAGP
ncbi:VWA domain-containing protein [Yinghuangia sp. YIM S09857]|uniref:VWA domain-containing protein n=1 Tax=Yinghuangia sp. YIM S09857 TaxID=3436929 RepID=UPI003F52C95F